MKKLLSASLVLLITVMSVPVAVDANQNGVLSAFKKVMKVSGLPIEVPTVVEVPLSEWVMSSEQFVVQENETGRYLGSYLDNKSVTEDVYINASAYPGVSRAQSLVDKKLTSYVDFMLPEEGVGKVQVSLNANQPVTSSRIDFRLAQYVALPLTVAVTYLDTNGLDQVAVAEKKVTGTSVTFPEVTSSKFVLTLTYSQPLRISEIELQNKNAQVDRTQGLRFLAQTGKTYSVYYDADRSVSVHTSEVGDLRSDDGVLIVNSDYTQNNQAYVPADVDEDGVEDTEDNCVRVPNSEQEDIDGNQRGDACDDWDKDGLINSQDNCVNLVNRHQTDTDHDGIGDACDEEESRFTEANPWVPWVGMGGAALVIIILFVLVAKAPKPAERREEDVEMNDGMEQG